MGKKRDDWRVIRAEYIRDESTSYRKLAKKYNVSERTLTARAIKEGWSTLRKEKQSKSVAKFIEVTSDAESKLQMSIDDVANELLRKISETLAAMPTMNGQTIKHFTSALKDLKDIKGERTEDSDDNVSGVVFLPAVINPGVNDGE